LRVDLISSRPSLFPSLIVSEGVWVNIKTSKNKIDRYARYIAEVEYNGVNISDYLLEKGVAKELKM
jgi:endonuclease YncB( thermonuclease family)